MPFWSTVSIKNATYVRRSIVRGGWKIDQFHDGGLRVRRRVYWKSGTSLCLCARYRGHFSEDRGSMNKKEKVEKSEVPTTAMIRSKPPHLDLISTMRPATDSGIGYLSSR